MRLKVLVFGNPLVDEDSIALRMLPSLRKRFPEIEFKEFDAAENLEAEGRDLVILDAAKGIRKVALIKDVGVLEAGSVYSMHDFDLSLTLRLLFKMGSLDSVKIIAVPSSCPVKKALDEASPLLSSLLSGNGSRSSCRGRRRG
jgi:Ni,Fe-hydrogenase maturation factor